ncbi:MAG: hypothetical protein LBN00_12150 [Oscillospiraceae bacterium]|jgi:hypothetical protein|nr:hypothetical protein [Oscillospiraceae bacterium]
MTHSETELALSFVESREICDYLRGNPQLLTEEDYCNIICCSRAPLEQKADALEAIAWSCGRQTAATSAAVAARRALEIANGTFPENTVFLLAEYERKLSFGEWDDVRTTPFLSLDAVRRFIKRNWLRRDYGYYEVTKYVPLFDGILYPTAVLTLDSKGDILRCDAFLGELSIGGEDMKAFLAEMNRRDPRYGRLWERVDRLVEDGALMPETQINLPVPFAPGDIITLDYSPVVTPRRAVIISGGDGRRADEVLCVSVDDDLRMRIADLAYTCRRGLGWQFAVLTRAERFTNGLYCDDAQLDVLREAMLKNPPLGGRLSAAWREVIDSGVFTGDIGGITMNDFDVFHCILRELGLGDDY